MAEWSPTTTIWTVSQEISGEIKISGQKKPNQLHQNQWSAEMLETEHPYLCQRGGEALKCRYRSLSTVTCMKHFNSCRWNEPFKRHMTSCFGRQGRLVMIALLWLSSTENKVFILCQSNVSSLFSPMRSPVSLPPPTSSSHLNPLVLIWNYCSEEWFTGPAC